MKPHRFTDDNSNSENRDFSGGSHGLNGENHGQESALARNLERLSVLRTGSGDLADSADLNEPEMADLRRLLEEEPEVATSLGRIQQLDAHLQQAMDDVPVPTGLADRLLARLADDCVMLSSSDTAAEPTPLNEHFSKPVSRRRLLTWGAALAASLLVASGIWHSMKPTPFTAAAIETLADDWRNELGENWNSLPLPNSIAIPDVLRGLARDWQRLKLEGAPAVAIRLGEDAKNRTTLFIIDRQLDPPAPDSPPSNPQWTTGGWSIAFWQHRRQLNVLMVEGGAAEYKRLVRPGTGALAMVLRPASAGRVPIRSAA
jgi:hypothetical protein